MAVGTLLIMTRFGMPRFESGFYIIRSKLCNRACNAYAIYTALDRIFRGHGDKPGGFSLGYYVSVVYLVAKKYFGFFF